MGDMPLCGYVGDEYKDTTGIASVFRPDGEGTEIGGGRKV